MFSEPCMQVLLFCCASFFSFFSYSRPPAPPRSSGLRLRPLTVLIHPPGQGFTAPVTQAFDLPPA